jgi:hypothetical protein
MGKENILLLFGIVFCLTGCVAQLTTREKYSHWLEEARETLEAERQRFISTNDTVSSDLEVGGSFRIRTTFLTGREYAAVTDIQVGKAHSVRFTSKKGDIFRMYLRSSEEMYYPSSEDYMEQEFYAQYGIESYFSLSDGRIFYYSNNSFHEVIY